MSESLHAPVTGPVISPQFQDSSVNGEDSVPGEGDVDMEDLVQPVEHQTSDQMFSHVDHEDYVSCGAPSNQVAIYPLEGKGSPPPDPQLSDYTPIFKHGKARKVERQENIVKKFDVHGQEDVLQVIASREVEKSEEGLPGCVG